VFEREQASVYLLYMRDVVGEVVAWIFEQKWNR
jgi:hypothetical protein